jgi:predicted  nucleic acid-binding Zn-ribbon protein
MIESKDSMLARALDVNKDNDGKAWSAEGVTGFAECSFRDTSPQGFIWKDNAPNWYKFTVFAGNVREVGKTTTGVQVKSFKVPKGFKLEYKGMFLKSKYDFPLSVHELDRIRGIPDNSFAKHVNTWTDETCAINMDFWYMNMQVTVHEYVKIARRIPIFLSLCIDNQKLSIRKSELELIIRKLESETEENKKKLFQMEKTLIEYEKVLQEKKTILINLETNMKIIMNIISNTITVDQWIQEVKSYKEEIAYLNNQIVITQTKITTIRTIITNLENQIQEKIRENSKLELQIATSKTQKTEIETTRTTTTTEITTIETNISKLNDEASKYKTENTNLNNKIKNIKDEIIKLQKQQKEAEDAIRSNDQNYNRLLNEITTYTVKKEKIIKSKEDITIKITTITNNIDQYNLQIQNNLKTIGENRKTITLKETEILQLEIIISKFKSDINSKTSYANKMTIEFYQSEKKRLEIEITKVMSEISQYQSQVTSTTQMKVQIGLSITESEKKVGIKEREEFRKIIESSKTQIQKIMAEYQNIKSIFSEQSQFLSDVISFNTEKVEVWTVSAKTKITKYLQLVPGNPTPIFDMARRRRRLRRYRRRFY